MFMENWSFKIARLWGIDIRIHITFIALLAWIWFSSDYHWLSVLITCAVFLTVILHEYGHALTARRFGIPTRDITVWMCGGVAALQGCTKTPKQEIIMALAGPAVNLVLAGITFAVSLLLGVLCVKNLPGGLQSGSIYVIYLLAFCKWFIISNLVLMGFNLIPAFPMDGGRVLRGLLNLKYDILKATEAAVRVSRVCAVIMALAGLYYDSMLVFIAVFVWLSGARELKMIQDMERMRRIERGEATMADLLQAQLGGVGTVLANVLQLGVNTAEQAEESIPFPFRRAEAPDDGFIEAEFVAKPSVKAEDDGEVRILEVKDAE